MATSEARKRANKLWNERHPEKRQAYTAGRTSEAASQASKLWHARNPSYTAAYQAKRRASDQLYKLRTTLSNQTMRSFKAKGWSKTSKTQALLGCTFEEFVAHLQSKFEEGMTLENHGDWHIDHIKPCATATSAEELAALFHFTNLQPLWATENLSKGCKYHE